MPVPPVKAITLEMKAFIPPPCPYTDEASKERLKASERVAKAKVSKPKSKGARVVEQIPPTAPPKVPPQEALHRIHVKAASPMPVPQKAAPKGGLRPPGLEQEMIGLEQDISSEDSEMLNRE